MDIAGQVSSLTFEGRMDPMSGVKRGSFGGEIGTECNKIFQIHRPDWSMPNGFNNGATFIHNDNSLLVPSVQNGL